MVKYSRTLSGAVSNQQLGIDIESDIPRRRASPRRNPDDDGKYRDGKQLKAGDDTSTRNCKIITALWALLTAGIIFIAQSKPPDPPPPPLHWSAAVISEARRASFVLENQVRPERKAECNVRSSGAVGDGETLDTAAILKALKLCAGHGVAVVPAPGVYAVETIRIPSSVTLRIEEGATLIAGAGLHPPLALVMYPFAPLLSVRNATDVTIEGGGTLQGRGLFWTNQKLSLKAGETREYAVKLKKHSLIDIYGSSSVLVRDIKLQDSAASSLWIRSSSLVVVDNVLVNSSVVEQQSIGVLIDSSQTVEVAHSSLYTGGPFAVGVRSAPGSVTSDVVVFANCVHNASGVGVMASRGGLVRDIVFKDLRIDGSFPEPPFETWQGGGLFVRAAEEPEQSAAAAGPAGDVQPQVERVLFEDVAGNNLTYGIDISVAPSLSDRGDFSQEPSESLPPPKNLLTDIEFHNITIRFAQERQVRLTSPPTAKIKNLAMEDVLFENSLRYGWECNALVDLSLYNVVPDVPLECTPHEEPPPQDYAMPLPDDEAGVLGNDQEMLGDGGSLIQDAIEGSGSPADATDAADVAEAKQPFDDSPVAGDVADREDEQHET